MNKTIAVLLAAVAGLLLLLFTCTGPGPTADLGADAPVPSGPTSVADSSSTTPIPAAEATASTGAAAPVPATARSSKGGATSPPLSSSGTIAAPMGDAYARNRSFRPVPAVPLRPVIDLPVAGVEAFLAVHPRDLEGGSGAGVLLLAADSLRDRLRLPLPTARRSLPTDYTRGHPSSTINTPTAYGQRLGDVYAGVGYQDRIRYNDWHDGVVSVGLGLGDPERFVGLDVAVNLLDTYTEFARDRSLSVKLHRRLPFRTAVAFGHENVWHTDGTDGGSSRYVVVSKVLLLRTRPAAALGSMVVNVGLGGDRFLPEMQFARGADSVNAFGSVGVRVLPLVNAVANWTGQDLALGLSVAPVRTWPLVITP
ncbi:MAG: hypothetical protein V5A48_00215, partial [Salinivenus sp.]